LALCFPVGPVGPVKLGPVGPVFPSFPSIVENVIDCGCEYEFTDMLIPLPEIYKVSSVSNPCAVRKLPGGLYSHSLANI
jgi:hypothetical protein